MNAAHSQHSAVKNGGPPLIYVVDDEAMLLELACVILQPQGYRLQTFRDPMAALQAFTTAKPRPALLLTDYSMHRMTGLDLIQACRRIEPTQRAALISGTIGPEIMDQTSIKPDRFLAKPYHARQLLDLVGAMLAS
ncbi:MAG TPA: response regulator [Verrucomicrobiae bacterium]|nr:response regulator [Verrucomicrobiae bacterium]